MVQLNKKDNFFVNWMSKMAKTEDFIMVFKLVTRQLIWKTFMNFKHVPSCVFVTFHPRKTSHCGHDFHVKYSFLLLNGVSISKIWYKWNANYHKGCVQVKRKRNAWTWLWEKNIYGRRNHKYRFSNYIAFLLICNKILANET